MFSCFSTKKPEKAHTIQEAPQPASHDTPKGETNLPPCIFVLLIAIDKYKAADYDLQGCVADATHLEKYLKETLSVPSSRIQKLFDNDATQSRIQDRILDIAKNDDVRRGDPILIYFAGCGSLASSKGRNSKVKMILPHDFDPENTEGERREGIPEFVLRAMLSRLAAAKGNHITMVFDSCYAVPDTQTDTLSPSRLLARGKELPSDYTILDTIKADSGPDQTPDFFANQKDETETRVILPAPVPNEEANQASFSKALVSLLNNSILDKVTFRQIVLPEAHQENPSLEDANGPFCLRRRGDKVVLCAGEADAIGKRSGLDLVQDESTSSQSQGIAFALDTGGSDSFLYLDNSHGHLANLHTFWVIKCRTGGGPDVRIFAPSTPPFTDFFPSSKIPNQWDSNSDIRLVEEEDADLRLRLEEEGGNSRVVLEPTHRVCQAFDLTQLHDSVPADAQVTYKVLEGAACFYRHLKRRISDKALAQFVNVECTHLVKAPGGAGLEPRGGDLIDGGVMFVDLKDTQSGFYGLKITNTSDLPLYVAVFYFNMSDLSIQPLYLPAAQGDGAHISLRARDGHLTIGYQSHWDPLQFELPTLKNGKLAQVDVGCVKVYLSTEYVDHSHIEQASPFENYWCPVKKRQPDSSTPLDTTEFAIVLRKNDSDGRGGTTIVQIIGAKIKTNQGK